MRKTILFGDPLKRKAAVLARVARIAPRIKPKPFEALSKTVERADAEKREGEAG